MPGMCVVPSGVARVAGMVTFTAAVAGVAGMVTFTAAVASVARVLTSTATVAGVAGMVTFTAVHAAHAFHHHRVHGVHFLAREDAVLVRVHVVEHLVVAGDEGLAGQAFIADLHVAAGAGHDDEAFFNAGFLGLGGGGDQSRQAGGDKQNLHRMVPHLIGRPRPSVPV